MKTAVKKAATKPAASTLAERRFEVISIELIAPSAFEPQARRRASFTTEDISELATSIGSKGLMQPILVRPKPDGHILGAMRFPKAKYEIVFGEKRWTAAKQAGLKEIDCSVRELSDVDALEIQGIENIQRKNMDPLDEAFYYRCLLDMGKYSVHDLAIKTGFSERYITHRLRLNDLIPEILEEVGKGWLPLGHAMEISKFSPEMQKRIHTDEAAYEWKRGDDPDVLSLKDLKGSLEEYLFSLTDAVFALDATNLREDGLACTACPERTGYEPLLFEEELKKGDSCLNEKCFGEKKKLFYQIARNDAAAKLKVDPKTVGFASDTYFSGDEFAGAKIHTHAKLFKTKACDKAEPVIDVKGENAGQIAYVCKDRECPKHAAKSSSSSSNDSYSKQQKEREFQVQVSNAVRKKIMLESATVFENKAFWGDPDLMLDLVYNVWSKRLYQAKDVIDAWDSKAPSNSGDAEKVRKYLAGIMNQGGEKLSQMIFLLLYGPEGFSSWSLADQSTVQAVNDRYAKLNYKLIDAETRLELAPKEHQAKAKTYLKAVQSGEEIDPPRFWYEEPKETKGAKS